MSFKFVEKIPFADSSGVKRTSCGYLVTEANCARVGVQVYGGHELGLSDTRALRVYRPPECVFDTRSLATYAWKPLTIGHPSEDVTAENWKALSVGGIGGEVVRDGDFVRVPLILMDSAAISAVESGERRELSMGYEADITMSAGVTSSGEEYDAIMSGIKINHIALVAEGRAGAGARIGDSWWGASLEFGDYNLKTTEGKKMRVTIGDRVLDVPEDAVDAINGLKKMLDERNGIIAAKDTIITAAEEKIKRLRDSQITEEEIERRVRDRANLITVIRSLDLDIDTTTQTESDWKKSVIRKTIGDEHLTDGVSDDFVEGLFRAAVAGHSSRSNDRELSERKPFADNGRSEWLTRLTTAWEKQ